MKINREISCEEMACTDILKESYMVPTIEIDPSSIKMIMISEVVPQNRNDYFYASHKPFYLQTTLQALTDAGLKVSSIGDILHRGIYLTTAVKCAKIQYAISSETIANCSMILQKEISLFPNVTVIMLNGNVAIKAMNLISKRQTGRKAIPSGSTYKIRTNIYHYKNTRIYPSYIITGKNFIIEKSKRKMIAEDIRSALQLIS